MTNVFLKKAKELTPTLRHTYITHADRALVLKSGESHIYDFGNHYVGYVTLKLGYEGSSDAPAFVKLTFCEDREELNFDPDRYDGWLSRSWIQQESVHFDILPKTYRLPRRYAFRYLKLEVISTSPSFDLKVEQVRLDAVSSAVSEPNTVGKSTRVRRMDEVALRTLHECMQYEFEDGPKRDRRLWLGDLRLQAQVNYLTYGQNDLVKRCLYLFAGLADGEGLLPGCLFTKPRCRGGNEMYDYPLLFIPTLLDYYEATGDVEAARELFPTAVRQEQLGRLKRQSDGSFKPDKWCFIDWSSELEEDDRKDACALAVYVYSAKALLKLGKALGHILPDVESSVSLAAEAAMRLYYKPDIGLFLDTGSGGISYATNTWMALASVADADLHAHSLMEVARREDAVKPVTPYMYHHYIEALCLTGLTDVGYSVMESYFGAMVDLGADTYRELFDPERPDFSPYGSPIVNSYCHAWSCAPAYFLRKYFTDK